MMPLTKKFKKKVDIKEMSCYCCQNFDNYARYFYFNGESNSSDKEEAPFAQEGSNNFDVVLLMANTH